MLQREVTQAVESGLPGVEVLALELVSPQRFCVYFANAVGRRVAVRTAQEIDGRKRFRGEVLAVGEQGFSLGAESGQAVVIPYDDVVRGNVIDEG
jgi:ribosome maturation factor RimP